MGWRCLKVSHVAGGDRMDGERERSALSQQNHANGIAGQIAAEASQNATNGWQEAIANAMPSPPRSISPCSEIQRLKK
ncbi:hypothetical protein PRIPAC_97935 [Pristionchus pacificus]|uniref:Uncharacterized protein n=1 Tax=Pristionchus pacificus TaxID=54126 RepID=A0A2A6CUW2_PRIPA|nr:hypothetical protein PRIPAC_97935 [Pristionchus pacificus]|eukprot:PDM81890.1 hypothetical protein PRIPAC_34044 [Pristionchus pacificus]